MNDVDELMLYAENDAWIDGLLTAVARNLVNKLAAGTYQHDRALVAYKHVADRVTARYTREFHERGPHGSFGRFSPTTRRAVAVELCATFELCADAGEYDHLVSKKLRTTWFLQRATQG